VKDFRNGLSLSATVLIGVLSGVSAPAIAQSTTGGPAGVAPNAQPNSAPSPTPPPQMAPAPAPAVNSSPFPGLTALGQTLKNDGVYLSLSYVYNLNSLVSGGFKTGTIPNGELTFGTVLDLQTILGIPEASFHITFDERSGFGLGNNVGTSVGVENNVGPTRATRLSEFYWEQGFDGDRIDVQIGRTNPTLNFATSDLSCEFVIGIFCAQPSSWYSSNNNEAFPASTWGGFLNIAATPSVYVRTGVFDDDTSQLNPNQQGFNWNVKNSSGVFIPMEVGYQTNFANARYPAKYDVGGYWDAASYTTPNGVPMQGRTAAYLQGEQTIWRPNAATKQSLTLFGGGIVYTGGAPFWAQYYAGIYDRGPFIARPDDTVGFIGSYYANNSSERPNKPGEWVYEVNYGVHPVPGITFKPYTQYIVSPNNFLAPVGSKQPSNAWVVGFQVVLNLGDFLGFPHFVAY
jgi:carbohydrate-selective porin OprB